MSAQHDAEVRLHGRRIGHLTFDKGGSTFRYEDHLADPRHQVLGQVFEDDPRTPRRALVGLPPWFAEFQQLARLCGHGAEWAADVVADAVDALRTAWLSGSGDETRSRFPALADHFERRMRELPICTTA